MVTKTSLSAIRALMYLAHRGEDVFLSPRKIAEDLRESPTYMAKVTRHLVKAGILRAEKGAKGGVRLSRKPSAVSLLEVVEACQGTLVGAYCQPGCDLDLVCGYHRAASELHAAISGVLSRWTLAQLLQNPAPAKRKSGEMPCVILSGISPKLFYTVGKQYRVPEG